jgi:hypothetical protein
VTLGQMNNARNWPKPDKLPPLCIVVVKGVHDESTVLSTDKNKGPFHWYARVVIEGNTKPKGNDNQILRPIPKAVVTEFVHQMAKLDHMKNSSLVTKYQPEGDNAKTFPVQPNGWKKVAGIKTEATPMQRAKKDKPGDDASEKAAAPAAAETPVEEASSSTATKPAMPSAAKKPKPAPPAPPAAASSSSSKRPASSPAPAPEGKKQKAPSGDGKKDAMPVKADKKSAPPAAAPPAAAPPAVSIKKEAAAPAPSAAAAKGAAMPQPSKKGSMLQFTQQAKPKLPAAAPAEAAPVAAPESSPYSVPRKRPAPSAEASSSEDPSLSGVFKKVARVDCDSRDKTTVFWVGNSVFIGQL